MSNVIAFRPGKFALGGGRFGQQSSPEDAFIHNAAVDLRFDAGLFRLGKLATNLAAIEALHTRSSGRWVKNGSGIWSFVSGSAMAIIPGLGYDGREAVTNYVIDPLFSGAAVGVVGSGGALPTGTTAAGSVVEIVSKTVKADGLTWLRVKITHVNSSGAISYPRWRFVQNVPTISGQVWRGQFLMNLISTSHPITAMLEGTPYERLVNQNLVVGLQEVNIGGTATALPTTVQWIFGPGVNNGETWTAEFEIAAPMLISKAFGMPFGVGAVSADSVVIPAAQAGMAVNPSLTGLSMFWRGIEFQATGPFPALMEARASDNTNRAIFYRSSATGQVGLECRSGNVPSSQTISNPSFGVERTIVLTWRPDGSWWTKFGALAPVLGSQAPITSLLTTLSIGNLPTGSQNNHITRRAGFLPTGLSDRAALDLFNQVNQGLAA